MTCRICGSEKGIQYRARSGMVLCSVCHKETPAKASWNEFKSEIESLCGEKIQGAHERSLRSFYADYKTSTIGAVEQYWESCSAD